MGKKSIRKCEVCGVRKRRESRIFLARFPLEPNRCRLWIKATGNEDLVYLPIVKLNENKFICGAHFPRTTFNKKGNRLKRNAVPTLTLNTPLSDEILADFPLQIEETPKDDAPCESQASESQQENKVRFSWQEPRITACSVEDEFERLSSDLIPQLGTETELHGNTVQTEPATHDNEYHDGYRCNECEEALYRFRYSCLQCEDYDICTSCEARGVHGTHYMLRVPGARPHNEVREVFDAVRSHVFNILNKHSTVLNDVDMSEDIKEELEEIKEEDPLHSVVMAMPFSPVEEETQSEICMIDDEYMSEPSSLNHSEDVQEVENTTSESIPLMVPKGTITPQTSQHGDDSIHRRVLSVRVNSFSGKSIPPIGGQIVILRGMPETDLTNHSTTAKTKMAPVKTTTMPANIDIKHAKRKIITIVGYDRR